MPIKKSNRPRAKTGRPAELKSRGSNSNSVLVEVAAALIFQGGKLLVTQRHAKAHLGGLWEFPGGKREPGETYEECLAREIREELGVEIVVGKCFAAITHEYPEKRVHLKFFLARIIQGQPRPIECDALQWVIRSELEGFDFPAADRQLLAKLKKSNRLWVI